MLSPPPMISKWALAEMGLGPSDLSLGGLPVRIWPQILNPTLTWYRAVRPYFKAVSDFAKRIWPFKRRAKKDEP